MNESLSSSIHYYSDGEINNKSLLKISMILIIFCLVIQEKVLAIFLLEGGKKSDNYYYPKWISSSTLLVDN